MTTNDATSRSGSLRSVYQAFELRAREHPEQPALACGADLLTYGQVLDRAGAAASQLRDLGAGPEVIVGLWMEKSPRYLTALLGAVGAGAAFLPLDPALPVERLASMMAQVRPRIVISDRSPVPVEFSLAPVHVTADELVYGTGEVPRIVAPHPSHLAYVIFTSGTAGRPKPVGVEHRSLLHVIIAQIDAFGIMSRHRQLMMAPIGYDASISEIFTTLLSGATLQIGAQDETMPGHPLARFLLRERSSVLTLSPSSLAVMPLGDYRDLEVLIVAGECCPKELADQWSGRVQLMNAYGPTECTVCASVGRLSSADSAVHVGSPLPGVSITVVDHDWNPLPPREIRELHIAGPGVARGYLGEPALTAERFRPSTAEPGARMYCTGDLGLLREDGRIQVVGRIDRQIKLRGHRIEPEEIEAVLHRVPGVVGAAVTLVDIKPGVDQLVAYLHMAAEADCTNLDIKSFLSGLLPEHMVPTRYVRLRSLPLLESGKVDLSALDAAEREETEFDSSYVEPSTSIEQRLAELWGDALGLERVGVYDDFFRLGGQSLLGTQLMGLVAEEFGIEIPVSILFDSPVIADLATEIELLTSQRVGAS